MLKIEIVSHVLADTLPHYADLLTYQLSSLILNQPKNCQVTATVCYYAGDRRTKAVLDWFGLMKVLSNNLHFHTITFNTRNQLGRRSIGRNMAAKRSTADIIWFSDVDQCYCDGILDRLAGMEWPDKAAMIFPRKIQIHKNHVTGDEAACVVNGKPHVVHINKKDFVPKQYNRAIGGVQIVQGDFAREHGYLDEFEKWQTAANKPFGDFRDDIAYRNYCKERGEVVGVDLPGVYRLRHSTCSYQ